MGSFFDSILLSSRELSISTFVFLYSFAIYTTAQNWKVHSDIYKNGIAGSGTLISCKRIYFSGKLRIIRSYEPIIVFFVANCRYQYRPMGRFRSPPGEVGTEVKIRFWHNKPEKVVIDDANFNEAYKKSLLWEGISFIAIMACLLLG